MVNHCKQFFFTKTFYLHYHSYLQLFTTKEGRISMYRLLKKNIKPNYLNLLIKKLQRVIKL